METKPREKTTDAVLFLASIDVHIRRFAALTGVLDWDMALRQERRVDGNLLCDLLINISTQKRLS